MHRPRARSWLAALMALVCCACAQLPGAQSGAVDDYMKAEIAKRHIPGAALIVIQHGQIVKVQGYGVANLEHDVPCDPRHGVRARLRDEAIHRRGDHAAGGGK